MTSYTCSATDSSGNVGTCSSTVTVYDTPPVIASVAANPSVIWPPNHKMTMVTVTPLVSDTCDTSPVCKIIRVTANEPISAADWSITGPLSVNLAASRLGTGTGRVYTVAVQCTNHSNETANASVNVTVPHDMGH